MPVYIFFRKEGWYPVEYSDDESAKRGAEINHGTLKVEDTQGNVIFTQPIR